MKIVCTLDWDDVAGAIDQPNEIQALFDLLVKYKALIAKAQVDHDGTEAEMDDFWADVDAWVQDCLTILAYAPNNGYNILDENGKEVTDPQAFYAEHKYIVLIGEQPLYVLAEEESEAWRIHDKVDAITQETGWYAKINGDPETGLFAG